MLGKKETRIVLRYAETSLWPGQYVALSDDSSRMFPVEDPFEAKFWADENKAIAYARLFGSDGINRPHIDPRIYILNGFVGHKQKRVWCNGTERGGIPRHDCPESGFQHPCHGYEVDDV